MKFIINSIGYIVYFVILFTGNMLTILADMNLATKRYFLRECEHNNVQCYFAIDLLLSKLSNTYPLFCN